MREMDGLETGDLTVDISGAGNLSIKNLQADSVDASMSGLGNLELSGKADRQSVSLSGAGNYDGGDLESGSADVRLSGLGNATVWATESLNASISGAGSIGYYGDPDVDENVSGLGDVTRRQQIARKEWGEKCETCNGLPLSPLHLHLMCILSAFFHHQHFVHTPPIHIDDFDAVVGNADSVAGDSGHGRYAHDHAAQCPGGVLFIGQFFDIEGILELVHGVHPVDQPRPSSRGTTGDSL